MNVGETEEGCAQNCKRKRNRKRCVLALTLMIAESHTEEKDVMVKVVVNLINQRNL